MQKLRDWGLARRIVFSTSSAGALPTAASAQASAAATGPVTAGGVAVDPLHTFVPGAITPSLADYRRRDLKRRGAATALLCTLCLSLLISGVALSSAPLAIVGALGLVPVCWLAHTCRELMLTGEDSLEDYFGVHDSECRSSMRSRAPSQLPVLTQTNSNFSHTAGALAAHEGL